MIKNSNHNQYVKTVDSDPNGAGLREQTCHHRLSPFFSFGEHFYMRFRESRDMYQD